MTATRKLTLAAALGAVTLLAGCPGKDCTQQTPAIAGVPSCNAPAGQRVTIQVDVCPKCDQGSPSCTVDMTNATASTPTIELVPLAPVCDPNSSCPIVDPASCPVTPPKVSCSFTVPDTVGTTYDLVVVKPDTTTIVKTLTVVAANQTLSCTAPGL